MLSSKTLPNARETGWLKQKRRAVLREKCGYVTSVTFLAGVWKAWLAPEKPINDAIAVFVWVNEEFPGAQSECGGDALQHI